MGHSRRDPVDDGRDLEQSIGLGSARNPRSTATGQAVGRRFAREGRQLGRGPSIVPSAAVIFAGFVLFWGIPNSAVAIAGITVAGLGASPLYPSPVTLLMERFPGATYEGSKPAALQRAPHCW